MMMVTDDLIPSNSIFSGSLSFKSLFIPYSEFTENTGPLVFREQPSVPSFPHKKYLSFTVLFIYCKQKSTDSASNFKIQMTDVVHLAKTVIIVPNEEEFCRRVKKSKVDLTESFRSEC